MNTAIQFFGSTTISGLKLDPDYRKVYSFAKANAIELPSIEIIMLQNQLVIDLKALGVFQKWDSFYMGINNFDLGEGYARINWINPSNNIPVIISNYLQKPGDVVWDKAKGFGGSITSNGAYSWSSLYVRGNYTLNDASIFGLVTQLPTIGGGIIFSGNETTSSTANGIITLDGANRINQSSTNPSPAISMAGLGYKSLFRTTSTQIVGWNNLSRQLTSRTSVSVDNNRVAFSVGNNAFIGFGGRGGSFDAETLDYMALMDQYINDVQLL